MALSFNDVQHITAAKICFFVFILVGLIFIYKKYKPSLFLFFLGGLSALSYYFFVSDIGLMFWGLRGDEITIAAMYEMFAHGSFWSDFAYPHLAPFYPPLFFWLFALPGRLFDWNGIQIAKVAAFVTIFLFPAFFYFVQKYFWSKRILQDKKAPALVSWFVASIVPFAVIDWDAIILKPYELLSASLIIIWTVALLYVIHKEKWSSVYLLSFGLSGAVLFVLFYFWFFLAAIGIALFNLFYHSSLNLKKYSYFALTGILVLFFSTPFWLRLALNYAQYGAENWQLGFLSLPWLATYGLGLEFSVRGIIFLLGLLSLIIFRQRFYIRALLCLFVSSYIWQMMGLFTITFFASPLQESKGFYFFNRIILVLAAAYLLEYLWHYFESKYTSLNWRRTVLVIGLILLSPTMFFGTFADDPVAQRTRAESKQPREGVLELVGFLKSKNDSFEKITLHSGITELYAYTPVNTFVYYNMHNSHPAADFSERFYFTQELARATRAEDFFSLSQSNNFGQIGRFIFFQSDTDFYPLYFHIDNFPNQSKTEIIQLPKKLFTEDFFEKVYESNQFVIFEPKKM